MYSVRKYIRPRFKETQFSRFPYHGLTVYKKIGQYVVRWPPAGLNQNILILHVVPELNVYTSLATRLPWDHSLNTRAGETIGGHFSLEYRILLALFPPAHHPEDCGLLAGVRTAT